MGHASPVPEALHRQGSGCQFSEEKSKAAPSSSPGWPGTHLCMKPSEPAVRLACITVWNSVSLQQYLKTVLLW